jgi:putative endonuclease
MWYVYIAQCRDKTLYTGVTKDLRRRETEHNTSQLGARYTSSRRPVRIIFSKKFINRSEASIEEARIKKLTRIEKLEIIQISALCHKKITGKGKK